MAMAGKLLPLHLFSPSSNPSLSLRFPELKPSFSRLKTLRIRCVKKSERTRKQRYPSEKKQLKLKSKTLTDVKNKDEGFWRLSKLGVPVGKDPGKDYLGVCDALLEAIAKVLEFPVASMLPPEAFSVVRKSFDARKLLKEPKFVYTVDMDVGKLLSLEPRTWDFISRLETKIGIVEHVPQERASDDLISIIHDCKRIHEGIGLKDGGHNIHPEGSYKSPTINKPKIAVVGSGPSGLFASLVLAELGAEVTLIERGQAVEQRGRDIGALVVRRILQSESNFCFGEGGAGTWSDGKLVTRIGRNSDSVLATTGKNYRIEVIPQLVDNLHCNHEVMKTLVHFGAPRNILVDGKPHLGTDRLIPLLRNFRQHLQRLGVTIKFGMRVDDLIVENAQVVGVKVSDTGHELHSDSKMLGYDAVVLAVGHSARDIYQMLLSHKVDLVPKDFSVGFRIEHPQELINSIQYSALATEVCSGRGKVPVADYKVVKYVNGEDGGTTSSTGEKSRSCYSFCMCPGGQVVLTSTNPSELCINGMSFSRRASRWANAALVVTVSSKDFNALQFHGPLAGVEFQREFERRAATMGGGNFVLPVQTVTDFLENKLSATSVPPSSYRLGVKAANLHELFPIHITEALQRSILLFDNELPGYISKDALLHGVETRTSSPIQIPRNSDTYESISLKGLYPIGEGAGYAGGIVSAAVDGLYAGFAVAKNLDLYQGDIESVLGKAQKNTGLMKY
ncbi:hypothetical protein HHK36_013791 [Tetracentron sinense]|uniref:FAD-binding domain-containing protein n=1 Tax=Tetracentron sinense TaxID=13715 RepID=A0A834Z8T5_TETSI|nr:hypothetical protein HHK36_013791 [Tetracentron sinense]